MYKRGRERGLLREMRGKLSLIHIWLEPPAYAIGWEYTIPFGDRRG